MEKSKVYYSDLRALPGTSLPEKLKKLIRKAGIGEIDFEKKMTAIKIHFGEPGNLSFLRPNYAKAVADVVKEMGGRPFLTDCNTLYVGRRKDALEHLSAAYENGFNILSTGCHIIIGDGLKGTDDVSVPVEGGELVKEAKIGRAVMDADVFISLSHFKDMRRQDSAAASRISEWAAEAAPARWSSITAGNRPLTETSASDAVYVRRTVLTVRSHFRRRKRPLTTKNV